MKCDLTNYMKSILIGDGFNECDVTYDNGVYVITLYLENGEYYSDLLVDSMKSYCGCLFSYLPEGSYKTDVKCGDKI